MAVQPAMIDRMILFIFMSLFTHNVHACIHTQRASLVSFASALSSPSLNWTSSSDCCYWEGITCNQDGWITHLQLPFKGLKLKGSSFPSSSLANLTYLTHLNLSHNSLSGYLYQSDDTFLSLKYLQVIDLSYNLLLGVLPSSLPSSHIQVVDFSSNRLHGVIPSSFLHQAWNLTSFNISNNTFSGPISSSMCLSSSSSLRHLDFSFNNFSGSIPSGLGKCSKLQVFRAGHNYLEGSLPEDIFNATTVEELSLPLNSLNGAISDGIANLIGLSRLDLSYNNLSGLLPVHIGKLKNLRYILLDFNSLQGSLPLSLMNCTKLIELRMGSNNLGGNLSMFDLSNLGQLTKFDLRMNNFFGVLPRSLYSCKFLKAIRVSYNNLEIEIPSEIVSLKSLSFLSLGGNKRLMNIKQTMETLMGCKSLVVLSLASSFQGEAFPSDLGKADSDGFQNVRILDMNSCNLTGPLPLWLLKFRNLESLTLSYNRITGAIPSWIGDLPRLYGIIMDFNQLSGTIPKELWMLPMFVSEQAAASVGTPLDLPIFYPSIDYKKPIQYNYLYYEAMISLKGNNLQGNIPSEIGQSRLLTYLDISNNNLSGNIPEQIAVNIRGIRALDLSVNHLSGSIPEAFGSLHFLASLNVSYNNLEGSIPLGTQLQSFDASSFKGNRDLCGAPLPKCKSSNEPDINNTNADMKTKKKQVSWFYVSAALGFIVGFWGVIGPLVLLKKWRNAYYKFLENVYERFMVMICKCMPK